MVAERWQLSRARFDEFSLAREGAAQDEGRFDEQIAPVTTPGGGQVRVDEGVRRGRTMERMAALRPAFLPDGVITAGNSDPVIMLTAPVPATRKALRDNGIRYGLQTMCEGGGQANATILELL
jgi:acetyl-CoA acyltransferase